MKDLPYLYSYEPNRWFNIKRITTIECAEYDPSIYFYHLDGGVIITLSEEEHAKFLRFLQDVYSNITY